MIVMIKFFKFTFYFLLSLTFYLVHLLLDPLNTAASEISEWATQQLEGFDE